MTKPTPTLETELRATIRRHALMAALINANMTLHAMARELQDEAAERRERLARIGAANDQA